MSPQTEAYEVKVAVVGSEKAVECVDQLGHLSTHQTGVNGRSNVIWQIGSVFPVDADDIDISLDVVIIGMERIISVSG